MTLKLISWNVNGLRACIQKGFLEQFQKLDADFFCLQETKLQEGQLKLELPGYEQYWCYAEKKGYSGTAIFTKHTPLSVSYGIGVPELDNEGRVITLEYPEFYLVNCYTPNAQRGLARLDHRMNWDEAYRAYIASLDEKKPTILCGDLNVAHQEIDLKNPGSNRGNAGFSDEERESFGKTLALGFTDTFRYLHPDTTGAYSWWSYMYHARENNAGWRIDYFLVSDRLREKIYSTPIYSDILGSDHCPVGLELDLSCNGSVWMEEKKGQPQVILPEKKGVKKTATVLLALLAVTVIAGLGGYAARLFSPSQAEYVTFTPYDRQLTLVHVSQVGRQHHRGKMMDGNTAWNLYSLVSSVAPPTPADIENFWLRLDLTEEALQAYSEDWTLTVSTDRSLTVGTRTSLEDECDLVLLSYYEGDDPSAIRGWFLYGRLPGDTKLYFNLNTGASRIRFTYEAVPSVSTPSIAEARKLDTEALIAEIVSSETVQMKLSFSSGTDYSDTLYENLKASSGELIELETREDAVTCLLGLFQDGSAAEQSVAHFLLSQEIYQSQMSNVQRVLFQTLEDMFLSLEPDALAKLATDDLLNYILNRKVILEKLHNATLDSYQEICELYPEIAEFAQREDMIQVLLKAEWDSSGSSTAIYYLLTANKALMTPDQQAKYMLGAYPSYPFLESPVHYHFILPLETKTPEELIRMLLLDSNLGEVLALADNDEIRDAIFDASVTDGGEFSYIIKHEDLIDTLFQLAADDCTSTTWAEKDYIKAFLRLSYIQKRMTDEQKAIFEESYSQFSGPSSSVG